MATVNPTNPQILSDEVRKALKEAGESIIQKIRDRLEAENINASGSLSDSLEAIVTDTGLEIWANDYLVYAEVGREAGRIPRNFGKILAKWVEDKGINIPEKYKDSVQFGNAIANKIRVFGSARHRGEYPKVDILSQPIEDTMPIIEEYLADSWMKTVNDTLVW